MTATPEQVKWGHESHALAYDGQAESYRKEAAGLIAMAERAEHNAEVHRNLAKGVTTDGETHITTEVQAILRENGE